MRDAAAIAVIAVVAASLWVFLRPDRILLDTIDDCFGPYVVARPDGVWERKRLSRVRTHLFAWSEVARIHAWADVGSVPLGPICYLEFALLGGGSQRICLDHARWKHFRARLYERFVGLEQSWDETFPDLDLAPPATIWCRRR